MLITINMHLFVKYIILLIYLQVLGWIFVEVSQFFSLKKKIPKTSKNNKKNDFKYISFNYGDFFKINNLLY